MTPPIPPYTVANLCSCIGDLLRASAAWGQADARADPPEAFIQLVAQAVAQLLMLCLQREPTADEMASVIGG